MARPMQPIDEGAAGEVLDILKDVIRTRGILPCPHSFWDKILRGENRYLISRSGFTYIWMRYQIAGLITVDPETHAYRVQGVDLVVKD